ncbi:hypothetical protein CRE_27559 [Caenorhabditis remanei]|uniref:Uncharacterized protein n=1 Tax=Caenorhabditis remanei TaxID=31234 RepID=E3LPC0_CAERE|nr:hypothetical protein CRE_27559 [Caenorhabditis remanei]
MNFYLFALFFILLIPINQASPVGHDEDEDMTTTASTKRPRIEDGVEDVMTTHPTFTVQRLDAPIERIEIRLIDDNTTHSVPEVTVSTLRDEDRNRASAGRDQFDYGTTTEQVRHRNSICVLRICFQPPEHVHEPDQDPSPAPTEPIPSQEEMYKKVEYVVQPTSIDPTHTYSEPTTTESHEHPTEPIVIGEDPYYYSTMASDKQASAEVKIKQHAESFHNLLLKIQAKAWISVSTSVPKFDGDIDEDDLPPPPAPEDAENEEPEEECLANKEKLTEEVIERLRSETTMYYRLVRQRNDQQKEFCGSGEARDTTSDMYRRCSNWRAEKLVYYYKLMRKTYCQVDNWPNSPKIKKTYGEYLNLFGTFYAFQK